MAQEIKSLFPIEGTATYYVPYHRGENKKKVYANGKLKEHFHYFKKKLKDDGIYLGDEKDSTDDIPKFNVEDDFSVEIGIKITIIGNCNFSKFIG